MSYIYIQAHSFRKCNISKMSDKTHEQIEICIGTVSCVQKSRSRKSRFVPSLLSAQAGCYMF